MLERVDESADAHIGVVERVLEVGLEVLPVERANAAGRVVRVMRAHWVIDGKEWLCAVLANPRDHARHRVLLARTPRPTRVRTNEVAGAYERVDAFVVELPRHVVKLD